MKKKSINFLALTLSVLTLASCGGTGVGELEFFENDEIDIGTVRTVESGKLSAYSESNPLRIALVTDSGTLDDHSFNQSAWEGVNAFATTNGAGTIGSNNMVETGTIQTHYYQPAENNYDTQGRLAAMRTAVEWGAKIIALPGYLFQPAIKLAIEDDAFDNVALLALDCVAEDSDNNNAAFEFSDNVTSVIYREEQSGFLAGYAAVKEGYRKLGFCGGMAVPAVVRYGSGYVQGAEYAATQLGLEDESIEMHYFYAGQFAATPRATELCTTWYNSGTEVIFGCGGAVYQSVVAGSVAAGGKPWIGVDVNQHADTTIGGAEEDCITSAMKNLKETTEVLLASYVNNNMTWPDALKAKVVTVGAKSNNCVLPTPETTGDDGCWGFTNFKQEDYDSLLADIKAGKIKINSNSDSANLVGNNFGATKVKVNYIANE